MKNKREKGELQFFFFVPDEHNKLTEKKKRTKKWLDKHNNN